jgi:hypothetical protein
MKIRAEHALACGPNVGIADTRTRSSGGTLVAAAGAAKVFITSPRCGDTSRRERCFDKEPQAILSER